MAVATWKALLYRLRTAVKVALSARGKTPGPAALIRPPAPHLKADERSNVEDDRASFRAYFCRAFDKHCRTRDERGCDYWLHRIEDEPLHAAEPNDSAPLPLNVFLVTGAFSECFGDDARPFHHAVDALSGSLHRFDTIVVSGRSGAGHNARQIADYLADHDIDDGRPTMMIGYSKGTTDILRFLVDYPEHAAQIDIVASVAGSVYGSPLADLFDGPYHLLFSHLPTNRCGAGDRAVVHSLGTEVRREWLASVELPGHLEYLSLAAFTTRDRVARALLPTWRLLLRDDQRNDGQLRAGDAIIPGSRLLGYLNADHWAAAMTIENEIGFFGQRRDSTPFPHTALLQALLDYAGSVVRETG